MRWLETKKATFNRLLFVPGRGFEPLILRMKILRPRPTRRTRQVSEFDAAKIHFFRYAPPSRQKKIFLFVFVLLEPETQTFTGSQQVRLLFQLQDVVHRDDLHVLVIRHQKVEIQRVPDGGGEDLLDRLGRDLVAAEIVDHLRELALALDVVVPLLVDEDAPDHVAEVVYPVVLQRVAQEVEDLDHAAVGTVLVLLDVRGAHHFVVAGELEDVGVHEENQHIATELEHELVLVLVGKEHRNAVVVIGIVIAVVFLETFRGILEKLHCLQRHREDALFQFAFGYQQFT